MDRSEVYLIDDDAEVRRALGALLFTAGLASRPYDSALAFLRDCDDLAPGCIITDVRMPGMDGLELLRRLKERQVPHPVIVITAHSQIPLVVEAFRAGAFDYIEKPLSDDAVLAAVRGALEEGFHRQVSELDRRTALATLTTREHQVLEGLVEGRSNKVIAHDLGISPRTVESHRANLMSKSGAQNLPGLVRLAVALGAWGGGSGGGGEGLPAAP